MSRTAIETVRIRNQLGLHARPAMLFVDTASGFEATVTVRRTDGDECVDGKSIMQMMVLAATKDTEIEICATGPDAEAAVRALRTLVEEKFHED